jgi:2-dehydropantoate 2-reductase
MSMDLTIIGSGAIGGTLGAHMIRAGHDITLCDADEAHVAAIRERGLIIEGPVNEFTVTARAITPDELPDQVEHAIVAVKSLHTRDAAELLRGRLAPGGYVLTVQNGLTADTLVDVVGRERVISSFVNFGADVMAPGRIMQGNVATFRVGELDGGPVTQRVRALVDALPYAEATENVLGYLWGKEAYGAMLWAGAVSDLTIAEHLEDPRYRPVMLAVAREVLAQAPVRVESFDGFEPDDLEGSLDRLAVFNRGSAKQYSGIYRDLVVRKRKTEIDEVLRDISGPVFGKVAEMIHDIEAGRRVNERANLDELAAFVAGLPAA